MNQHSSPEGVGQYLDLLRGFLELSIDVSQFEEAYLALMGSDPAIRSEEVFGILDTLFGAVDAYSPFPAEETIDESELRQHAAAAYQALLALTERGP